MARRDSSLKAWCQKNGHMELLQELANEINSDQAVYRRRCQTLRPGLRICCNPNGCSSFRVSAFSSAFAFKQKIDIGYRMEYNAISSEPDKSGQSPRRCVWSRFVNGEHG